MSSSRNNSTRSVRRTDLPEIGYVMEVAVTVSFYCIYVLNYVFGMALCVRAAPLDRHCRSSGEEEGCSVSVRWCCTAAIFGE